MKKDKDMDGQLKNYPNIQAVIDGRVSGKHTEWPVLREELKQQQKQLKVYQEVVEAYEKFYGVNPEHTSLYAEAHDELDKALNNLNGEGE